MSISGNDASLFTIEQSAILSTIPGGSSTSFGISFHPDSVGIKIAKITILNNDGDENPYTFSISGMGIAGPEINVKQGTNNIPTSSGNYNFDEVLVNDSSAEVIFTIENLGTSVLHLSGMPDKIEVTGTDAAMFSVNQTSTDKYITPGSSTTFGITLSPTSDGNKSASISIANNDSDENPYTFNIKGKGVTPEINIKQGSDNILNSTGSYDFGKFPVGNSSSEITFTIENFGNGNLILSGTPKIAISGTDSAMFTINQTSTVSPVTPSNSTTFSITFLPSDGGSKSATISITNNDLDENPYTFTVAGVGENGAAIGWIGGGSNGWKTGTAPSSGTDYQSFSFARDLCIDSNGNIYVADYFGQRICKWDSAGNAIGWIGGGSNGWKTTTAPSNSALDYQSFYWPNSVFVDSSGNIFVADNHNNRISKWDSSGNAIGWIGGGSNGWKTSSTPSEGSDYQSFRSPKDVFVNSAGVIFVADIGNMRISKWDSSGNAIGWIGGGSNGWKTGIAPSSGTDYQSFYSPGSVFVDTAGNIYIVDNRNDRICKWDGSGNAIGWIGGGSNGWKTSSAPSEGSDYQSFESPSALCVSSSGNIYVADRNNHRICKWDNAGNAIGWIGDGSNGWKTGNNPSYGLDYQSFRLPMGVFIDSSQNIFVSENGNNRISKWRD